MTAQHALLQATQARQLHLEKELELRNQALLQATIAAAEATRARLELLTRMGHDLRAPLTAIMGYADLVAHREGRCFTPASGVERSARKMLALIDGFMDCARGSVLTEPLKPQPVYLHAFLANVAARAATAAKKNGNRFDCRVATALPDVVVVDARRLRQVLAHLLANAARFTSGGQIELLADLLPSTNASGDRLLPVVFTVRDTGPGMPQDQADTLFDPWQRLAAVPNPANPGHGLGLVVTYQWVLRMDGHIEVLTAPGQGTTVRVIVPLKPSSEQAMPVAHLTSGEDADQPLQGAGRLLWIVDDSAAIRSLLGNRLEFQGFTLLCLPCGQDAVSRMAQPAEQVPDLILTDLKMPGVDGWAVLACARATWPDVPVVLMTSAPELVPGDGHGFSAVLVKPLSMALLQRTLARLLDRVPRPTVGAKA
ncbi:hybrid sensor histidine kinase/response regulator [Polaromonas sp.]|uniref:ATP-binding response regulator n=1 Tax=Polaromonas sp. TaxID=1869339 RepID=UPI0013BE89E9|nr:hybrid sensor histidine kinase/response regulator [Polaromonas sp.]NDP64166.1 hybrid sensor histidine kinase/response regulator [Polaromonas sp.]